MLVFISLVVLVSTSCSKPSSTTTSVQQTFPESAIRISAVLTPKSPQTLKVTFDPLVRGMRLYGENLPLAGVNGLGVPTTVKVSGGLRQIGSDHTNVDAKETPIGSPPIDLPVYPSGPVTFIESVRILRSGPRTVELTFGGCTQRVCYLPVRNARLVFPR